MLCKKIELVEEIKVPINSNDLGCLKQQIKRIHNTIYTKYKVTEKEDTVKQIKNYINKRCINYKSNQRSMIDSMLSKNRKKIVLDRVLVENTDGSQELLLDPEDIKDATVEHFKKAAGITHEHVMLMNERWTRQYTELSFVKDEWYNEIMTPPTLNEWLSIIHSLPNNKASGPSQISNEMLKHLGKNTSYAIWRLVCSCLQLEDIPDDWKVATIYPIPKPTE